MSRAKHFGNAEKKPQKRVAKRALASPRLAIKVRYVSRYARINLTKSKKGFPLQMFAGIYGVTIDFFLQYFIDLAGKHCHDQIERYVSILE